MRFFDECRHEWKRLRVPGEVADDMAAELEGDIAAAASDGVAPDTLFGPAIHDPRGFARTWALERGVGRVPLRERISRRGGVAAAAGLMVVIGAAVLAVVVALGGGARATVVSVPSRASFSYAAFRPSHEDATLPRPAARLAKALLVTDARVPKVMRTGVIVARSTRVLLLSPGTLGQDVYGFATTSGRACEVIAGLLAGCDRGQAQTVPIVWMSGGRVGGPGVITGLARDGVSRIDALVGSRTRPTLLHNNSFYVELPLRQMPHVRGLRVTMEDGARIIVRVHSLG